MPQIEARSIGRMLRWSARAAIGCLLVAAQLSFGATKPDDVVFSAFLNVDAASLQQGKLYRVEVDGVVWEGRYTGIQQVDGRPTAIFENCQPVTPGPSSNLPKAPAGSQTSSQGDSDRSSAGGSPGSDASAAAKSGAVAAGTVVVYRLLIVPPSLQRELGQASQDLQRAEAERIAAVGKYQTLIREVTVSREAWERDLLNRVANPPTGPLLLTSGRISPTTVPTPFKTTVAADRAALTSVYEDIVRARVLSPAHAEAKDIGTAALSEADQASVEGDRSGFATALAIGRAMADVLVGLDPFTGLARDSLEFYTGVNQITGETLTDGDRKIRLLSAGMTIVSLGVATSCVKVVGRIANIIKRLRKIPQPPPAQLVESTLRLIKTPRGTFELTKHATDALNAGEMSRKQVEKVIEKGERFWDAHNKNISYWVNQGRSSYQVAVDPSEERIMNVLVRPFNPNTKLQNGLPRWVPMRSD